MSPPLLALQLVLVAAIYAAAAARTTRPGDGRPWWFLAGMAVVAVAIVSPLHGLAERSLAAHMAQHVLLISVAAPLLALGAPVAIGAEVLGRHPPGPSSWRWVIGAALVQVGFVLMWHAPPLFDAAARNGAVHGCEHLLLLVPSVVAWDAFTRLPVNDRGLAVVALFIASLPVMAFGVALTLARDPWYSTYRSGDWLRDQQVAGVVMWAYGGLAAVIGGVALGVDWVRTAERDERAWGRS